MRIIYKPILLLAVLGLAGCPSGAQGPAGPKGASGATGATGPAGASAAIRITAVAAGATCATGGQLVEGGIDTNGNGTLDDAEVTTSADVCNGDAGPQGPASAWQLVSADGFTFGQVTGLDGWLWNASVGGYLPKPVQQGTDLVLKPPASPHRIYFSQINCFGTPYFPVASLGSDIVPHDARIPEAFGDLDIMLWQVDWTTAPASYATQAYTDLPTGTCVNTAGQVDGLVPLSVVSGVSISIDRIHQGPATLKPVTVP